MQGVIYDTLLLEKSFNPRSLTGATPCNFRLFFAVKGFNPRSLTGATTKLLLRR